MIDLQKLIGRKSATFSNVDFGDKKILVTGAAGSIGSEICRKLKEFDVTGFDQSETGLFELRNEIGVKVILGNIVTDYEVVKNFDYVFHSAAYKHVGMMEEFPEQAIRTNIFGTQRLIENFNGKRFVLISTDKAANPKCIMGMSKRVAEDVVTAWGGSVVRFGNVIGSNGSVLTIWERQLKEGKPLTVTDKEATRYFMTIPEAASLVIETAMFKQGKYLLDMGEPININNLAERFIELSGVDSNITYTGLKKGEKLHEQLTDNEHQLPTSHTKIFEIQKDN
jgi:FlaA1/EpsC-like NDP-sugar epimerase